MNAAVVAGLFSATIATAPPVVEPTRDAIAQSMSQQAKLAQLVTRCGGDEALLAKLTVACASTSR
mgnify:CR=1 FL=1